MQSAFSCCKLEFCAVTISVALILTYKYRIKDGKQKRYLDRLSRTVNFVWNFCNDTQKTAVRRGRKWPSGFDLNNLTSGSAKELKLHSQTIQAIGERYVVSRQEHKKRWLRYRGKKSLGWIPFKASGLKHQNDSFKFNGRIFRVWYSRPLRGEIKCGSFSQDSLGRWYLNVTCEIENPPLEKQSEREVGIDLGLKTFATCSNGDKINAQGFYRDAEERFGKAQRARKNRQSKRIACDVANRRKDFQHKLSTKLVKEHSLIVIGNVSSSNLAKTKMAKSVLDAGWSKFRNMLAYKAIAHQAKFFEVDERNTTRICSACKACSGPKGIADLGIREWCCDGCGTTHDRDINSAQNILRLGRETLAEGILVL